MTPEDFARLAVPCFGPPHCTGNDHDYECDRHDPERFNRAVEQISAALRERDARLKDFLDNLVPHSTSAGRLDLYGQHRDGCAGDENNIACACGLIQSAARFHAALTALRALLEEAGK